MKKNTVIVLLVTSICMLVIGGIGGYLVAKQPNTVNVISPTATPSTTIYPTATATTNPSITPLAGCLANRSFTFPTAEDSLTAITTVKNALLVYPGMRYFYVKDASVLDDITVNCTQPDAANTIEGDFDYKGTDIKLTEGYWSKGGDCQQPMDETYLGKQISICETGSGAMGVNYYSGLLLTPTDSSTTIGYNLSIQFSGYFDNVGVQNILNNILELK